DQCLRLTAKRLNPRRERWPAGTGVREFAPKVGLDAREVAAKGALAGRAGTVVTGGLDVREVRLEIADPRVQQRECGRGLLALVVPALARELNRLLGRSELGFETGDLGRILLQQGRSLTQALEPFLRGKDLTLEVLLLRE